MNTIQSHGDSDRLRKVAGIGKLHAWCKVLAGLSVAAAVGMGGTTQGAPYQYPSSLPQKDVKPRMMDEGPHVSLLSTGNMAGKNLSLSVAGVWHLRASDGTAVAQAARFAWKMRTSAMLRNNGKPHFWEYRAGIYFPDAKVGDVFLAYFLYKDPAKPWVSEEMAFVCGGRGQHESCTECYRMIPLSEAKAVLESKASRATQEPSLADVRPSAAEAERPKPAQGSVGPSSGNGKTGTHFEKVVLERETPVYSLKTWPPEKVLGKLKAGSALFVMEDLGDEFVRVRVVPSAGRKSVEGAVRKDGLGIP